jgi:hypothetical protein
VFRLRRVLLDRGLVGGGRFRQAGEDLAYRHAQVMDRAHQFGDVLA